VIIVSSHDLCHIVIRCPTVIIQLIHSSVEHGCLCDSYYASLQSPIHHLPGSHLNSHYYHIISSPFIVVFFITYLHYTAALTCSSDELLLHRCSVPDGYWCPALPRPASFLFFIDNVSRDVVVCTNAVYYQ
jgi:hypothetical protein